MSSGIAARRTQRRSHDPVVAMVREIARETYKGSFVSESGKFLPEEAHDRAGRVSKLGRVQPDQWVRLPNRWFVVYEIWAQGESAAKAAYEVFRIALTRKVRRYNIICLRNSDGTGWGRRDAFQLARLVLDNVRGDHIKSSKIRVAEVDSNMIRDKRRAKRQIRTQLK